MRVRDILHKEALGDGGWSFRPWLVEGEEPDGELAVGALVGAVEDEVDEIETGEELRAEESRVRG